MYVPPGMTEALSSPNYPLGYEPGVLCVWEIETNVTHVIRIKFEDVNFGQARNCSSAGIYVRTKINKKQIQACGPRDELRVPESSVEIYFRSSRIITSGKGFRIHIKTAGIFSITDSVNRFANLAFVILI